MKVINIIFIFLIPLLAACADQQVISSREFNSGGKIDNVSREETIKKAQIFDFAFVYKGEEYNGNTISISGQPYRLVYENNQLKYLVPDGRDIFYEPGKITERKTLPLENGLDWVVGRIQSQAVAKATETAPIMSGTKDNDLADTALGVLELASYLPAVAIGAVALPVTLPMAMIQINEQPRFAKNLALTKLGATREQVQKQFGRPGLILVSNRRDYEIWAYQERGQDTYRPIKGYLGFLNGQVIWKKVDDMNFMRGTEFETYVNENNVDEVSFFHIGPVPPKKAFH